jgi:uncharacterized repeat protein (TIGR01451 family)
MSGAEGVEFYASTSCSNIVKQSLVTFGFSGDVSNTAPLLIGAAALSPAAFFQGRIDEVEIFKSLLSPDDVKSIVCADCAGKCRPRGIGDVFTGADLTVQALEVSPPGIPFEGQAEVSFMIQNIGREEAGPADHLVQLVILSPEQGFPVFPLATVTTRALAPGASQSFKVPVRLPKLDSTQPVPALIRVFADVNDALNESNEENGVADTPVGVGTPPLVPDLMTTKSHSGNFTVGQNGVYTITVKNVGNGPTTGTITVTDTLPPGMTYVSGTGTGWTCTAGTATTTGQPVTCTNPGPLAANATSTITLTVSVTPAVLLFPNPTNCAEAKTPGDTNAENDRMCDPTSIAACVTPPPNLRAWWTMDVTSGTTVPDIAGTNNGTHLVGTTASPVLPTAGKVAGALTFGLGPAPNSVQVPNSTSLNFGASPTADLSIDAWVRANPVQPSPAQVFYPIVDKLSTGALTAPRGYSFYLVNGRLGFAMADGTTTSFNAPTTSLLVADGQWHHVAVTVDRDQAAGGKLYVDGNVVFTFNPTVRAGSLTNTINLLIGRNQSGNQFLGSIDEVEIFSRALTEAEVKAIFNADSAGKCKPSGPPGGQADFAMTGLTVTPPGTAGGPVAAGSQVRVAFNIVNQGTGNAGAATHRIRLLSQSLFGGPPTDVITPITVGTGTLAPMGSQSFSQMVTIPASTPIGIVRVTVEADFGNAVMNEASETNNTAEFQITITPPSPIAGRGVVSRSTNLSATPVILPRRVLLPERC